MAAHHERSDYAGSKFGMWFFLYTEFLFFGGMFLLYSVYRSRYPQQFHAAAVEENLVLGSINTAVLLTSSLLIALSILSVKKGRRNASIALQSGTVLLGIVFLIIKYFEWSAKIVKGLYPASPALRAMDKGEPLFFSLYFMMTGVHGLHVLVGVAVIIAMIFLTAKGDITAENIIKLENTGLYWHFVDIIWIYLFPLFYLVT